MKNILIRTVLAMLLASSAVAEGEYVPTASMRYKPGNNRTIYSPELFLPLASDDRSLLFADIRSVISIPNAQEYNVGLGYRQMLTSSLIGGMYGFLDRRNSTYGNNFYQTTLGAELLADRWDVRVNGYVPLTRDSKYAYGTSTVATPQGTGIYMSASSRYEQSLDGADIEFGVKPLSEVPLRMYAGGYWFTGDDVPNVEGVRGRLELEVHRFLRLGGEMQYDKVRGHNSYLEARVTVPLSWEEIRNPRQRDAMQQRMTTPIVRDIDIVTTEQSQDQVVTTPMTTENGQVARIVYVDNSGSNGDGSYETPYNNLADAVAAATDETVIYVRSGTGTTTGLSSGYSITQDGVKLVGAGTGYSLADLGLQFNDPNGILTGSTQLFTAGAAPVITAAGTAVTVSANNVVLAGLTIDNAGANGVSATGDNLTLRNLTISDATGTAVQLTNVANVTVRNSTITDAGFNGISATYANITGGAQHFISNTINGSGQNGISVVYNGASSNTLQLASNRMDDNTINSAFIRTNGTSSVSLTVTSNTITNTNAADTAGIDAGRAVWYMAADTSNGYVDITSNTFTNNRGESVEVETKYSTASTVNGRLAYNSSTNAISSTTNTAANTHFFIEGNTGGQVGSSSNRFLVYNNTATTADEEGIVFKGTGGTVYGESYNNVTSYNDDGQEVRSQNAGFADVVFHNNTSHHNRESGIQVDNVIDDGETHAWVYDNTIYSNTGQGIQVASALNGTVGTSATPIVIENNTLSNNGTHNIILKSTDGTTGEVHVRISSNTLTGATNGIYMTVSGTNTLDANIISTTITNNTGRGVVLYSQGGAISTVSLTNVVQTSATVKGMFVDMRNTSHLNMSVVSSSFSNNTGDGMEINVVGDSSVSGSIISSTMSYNGDDGLSILADGVDTGADTNTIGGYFGSSATPIVMTGNRFVNNTGDGIEIRSVTGGNGVAHANMSYNTITNNGARGINMNEFDTVTGTNNIVIDMGGGVYGSTGYNSNYANAGYNVYYNPDVNGSTLKAENNWWGQDADPASFDEASDSDGLNEFGASNGGLIDASPRLNAAP